MVSVGGNDAVGGRIIYKLLTWCYQVTSDGFAGGHKAGALLQMSAQLLKSKNNSS